MADFQSPKGTRDFYPDQMALRRHVENIWRKASVDCGFDEIEGPTFEHLSLFTAKSGPGIVSELFSFRRAGGSDDYALRPEFTPTLARMAAARAGTLSVPTKWFAIPLHFRAERPQRGRLREFVQWNVDLLGSEGAAADCDVIACAALALERLGLKPTDVCFRLAHRGASAAVLTAAGVAGVAVRSAVGPVASGLAAAWGVAGAVGLLDDDVAASGTLPALADSGSASCGADACGWAGSGGGSAAANASTTTGQSSGCVRCRVSTSVASVAASSRPSRASRATASSMAAVRRPASD